MYRVSDYEDILYWVTLVTCDAWYKLAIAGTSRRDTFEMDHSKHYHSLGIFPSDKPWRVEKTTTDFC